MQLIKYWLDGPKGKLDVFKIPEIFFSQHLETWYDACPTPEIGILVRALGLVNAIGMLLNISSIFVGCLHFKAILYLLPCLM